MDYVLSNDAEKDLATIGQYTYQNFGIDQTKIYKAKLFDAFEFIRDFPHSGRQVFVFGNKLHRYEIEKHVIFYEVNDGAITIIRILHQAIDFLQALE